MSKTLETARRGRHCLLLQDFHLQAGDKPWKSKSSCSSNSPSYGSHSVSRGRTGVSREDTRPTIDHVWSKWERDHSLTRLAIDHVRTKHHRDPGLFLTFSSKCQICTMLPFTERTLKSPLGHSFLWITQDSFRAATALGYLSPWQFISALWLVSTQNSPSFPRKEVSSGPRPSTASPRPPQSRREVPVRLSGWLLIFGWDIMAAMWFPKFIHRWAYSLVL